MKPFFKWSGGKRKEAHRVLEYMPKEYDTYYEPFVGAGAIWLHLEPNKSVVNDSYTDVINFYKVLKNNTDEFIEAINHLSVSYNRAMSGVKRDSKLEKKIGKAKGELDKIHYSNFKNVEATTKLLKEIAKQKQCEGELGGAVNKSIEDLDRWQIRIKEKKLEIKNLKEEMNAPVYEIANKYYYHYRDNQPQSDFDKAVRFYILRQLSFSGMLRFDRSGNFNVPYGWYKSFKGIEQDKSNIKNILNNTTLMCSDWKESLSNVTSEDFVFLDPPYTRTFTDYHPNGQFGDKEHIELAEWFKTTKSKAMIILNRDEFTEGLYKGYIKDEYKYKYSIQYRDRIKKEDNSDVHFLATNY